MRLKIGKKLKTASLNSNFTGSYNKNVYLRHSKRASKCTLIILPVSDILEEKTHGKTSFQRWNRGHSLRGQDQGPTSRGQTLSRPTTGMLEVKAKD